jgi:hypothetical protein
MGRRSTGRAPDDAGRTTVVLATGWCGRCEMDVDFERPICADHPDDCPELICTLCATAYVGGEIVPYPEAMSTTPMRAAVTPAA